MENQAEGHQYYILSRNDMARCFNKGSLRDRKHQAGPIAALWQQYHWKEWKKGSGPFLVDASRYDAG